MRLPKVMNAIILHAGPSATRGLERRELGRSRFARARQLPTGEPLPPREPSPTENAARRVRVHRRPVDEPFEAPRDTGDPRTQLYAEHEALPGPWASWQFINFLI
jgi:hypothetical protein